MKDWRSRYADGRKGICDFGLNYDFYFKWLTNKIISCFCIRGAPETINDVYLKTHLILDGNICITDFGDLYACIGSWGGQPDEYYIPKQYVIANPILGSKTVDIGRNGIVITNTSVDGLGIGLFDGGLYDLIHQTATLLADNIISINCCQINSRITTFFTADGEANALAGEAVLKKMYAGSPYQVLRQSIVEKLNVNPVSNGGHSQTLTELVELHNYIIANFFQSIGIRANNVMKRERLITSEIESQNDFVKLSLTEILASWQKGFDKVNELYGTEITVELNPVLVNELIGDFTETESVTPPAEDVELNTDDVIEEEPVAEETTSVDESEQSIEEPDLSESVTDQIEEKEEIVDDIVDIINDNVDSVETVENEDEEEEGEDNEQDEKS